jgi:hypothetical protein
MKGHQVTLFCIAGEPGRLPRREQKTPENVAPRFHAETYDNASLNRTCRTQTQAQTTGSGEVYSSRHLSSNDFQAAIPSTKAKFSLPKCPQTNLPYPQLSRSARRITARPCRRVPPHPCFHADTQATCAPTCTSSSYLPPPPRRRALSPRHTCPAELLRRRGHAATHRQCACDERRGGATTKVTAAWRRCRPACRA